MDHRWDELLEAENRRRAEQGRYGARPIEEDRDVERRDRIARMRGRVNKSPWEIGASHWDQRDLYTRGPATDERGYARGPAIHPEVGSYAYHRDDDPPPATQRDFGPSVYEREAWPWLNYERFQPVREEGGLWGRVKHAVGRITGHHEGSGPKGWRRSDQSIREDVCEVLAYDGRLDATDIEVTVKDAEVTLEGVALDREQKRLAEDLAGHVRGVEDVHNRLRLKKDERDDSGGDGDNFGDALTFATPLRAV